MIVTFTEYPIYLSADSGYAAEQWYEWIKSTITPQVRIAQRHMRRSFVMQSARAKRKLKLMRDVSSKAGSSSSSMARIPTSVPTAAVGGAASRFLAKSVVPSR